MFKNKFLKLLLSLLRWQVAAGGCGEGQAVWESRGPGVLEEECGDVIAQVADLLLQPVQTAAWASLLPGARHTGKTAQTSGNGFRKHSLIWRTIHFLCGNWCRNTRTKWKLYTMKTRTKILLCLIGKAPFVFYLCFLVLITSFTCYVYSDLCGRSHAIRLE